MANARMGGTLRLAARPGERHATVAPDLHAGALRRARRRAAPGTKLPSTRAMASKIGVRAHRSSLRMSSCSPKATSRAVQGSGTYVSRGSGRACCASGAARDRATKRDKCRTRRRRSPSSRNRPRKPTRGRSTPAARWSTRARSRLAQADPSRRAHAWAAGPRLHGSLRLDRPAREASVIIYGPRAPCVASPSRSSSQPGPSTQSTSLSACCLRPATRCGSRTLVIR